MKKEIPILFSTPMVQAILDGRKTITRRIVKPQPDGESDGPTFMPHAPSLDWEQYYNDTWKPWHWETSEGESIAKFCPYGKPGDLLWVREEHYRYGQWIEKEGVFTKTGRQKWQFIPHTEEVRYSDNPPAEFRKGMHNKDPYYVGWYKRLARFMPKSATRIWLEVTEIRVERLQDITVYDAGDEGIEYWNVDADAFEGGEFVADYKNYMWRDDEKYEDYHFPSYANPIYSFRSLWMKINGQESWNQNPWVWVVSFKVLSTTGKHEEKYKHYNFTNRNNLETSYY